MTPEERLEESVDCMGYRLWQWTDDISPKDCRDIARKMIEADLLRRATRQDPDEAALGQAIRYGLVRAEEGVVDKNGSFICATCISEYERPGHTFDHLPKAVSYRINSPEGTEK